MIQTKCTHTDCTKYHISFVYFALDQISIQFGWCSRSAVCYVVAKEETINYQTMTNRKFPI